MLYTDETTILKILMDNGLEESSARQSIREAVEETTRRGHPIAYWRRLVCEGVPVGERNNTIASLAGHLLRHGVDAAVVMELLLCWNRTRCRPPLADEEVAAVVTSISRLHARDEEAHRQLR